jgi:hypothetical protein
MADDRDRLAREREQQQRLDEQARRVEAEERAGWGWFGWWWLWIIVLIFIIWFGGWGWWGYGGWWGWGGRAGYAARYQGVVPDSLVVLTSPDKQSYIGRQIALNNVQVQGTAGQRGYWIGPNGNRRLLVVGGNTGAVKLQAGQLVSVNGTVERAPTAQQAQAEWGISSDEAARLEKDGVYIQAGQLQASNRHQP